MAIGLRSESAPERGYRPTATICGRLRRSPAASMQVDGPPTSSEETTKPPRSAGGKVQLASEASSSKEVFAKVYGRYLAPAANARIASVARLYAVSRQLNFRFGLKPITGSPPSPYS